MKGHWEPHTGSIDFCEENYAYTPYVAEVANAASAVSILIIPVWLLLLTPLPYRHWMRFILCFGSLVVVGFGSIAFHATLNRAAQALDEVPMIFVNLVYLYCIARPKPEQAKALIGILSVLGFALFAFYFAFEWYAVFFGIFAVETVYLIGYSYQLCFYENAGGNGTVLRTLWKTAVSVYFVAVCCWFMDNIACVHLSLGYLHVIWHLLGSFGSAMFPVILVALQADADSFTIVMRWHILMPYLVIDPKAAPLLETDATAKDQQEPCVSSDVGNPAKDGKEFNPTQVIDSTICGKPSVEKSAGKDDVQESVFIIALSAFCALSLQVAVQVCFWLSWLIDACICRRRHNTEDDDNDETAKPSVSFSGCAFWWPYMAGVCQYLFEEFDMTHARIFTTSASTFPVVCALMGVNPLQWCMVDYPKCLEHWNSRPFSCFLDSTTFLRNLWHRFLPGDAYQRAEGRLVVSVTQVPISACGIPRLHNEQVTSFKSNDDLIDCLMATINLPGIFFRGLPTRHGQLSIDGCYSEQKRTPGKQTVVVGLSGTCDIRPSKRIPWLWAVLPQPMERTKHMMRLGYEDARVNHAMFVSRGWRAKAAGPADSLSDLTGRLATKPKAKAL